MISATAFAHRYSSIWQSLAPSTELFVRKLNSQLVERIFPPMKTQVEAGRRAYINEIAFRLFAAGQNDVATPIEDRTLEAAMEATRLKIVGITGNLDLAFEKLSEEELADAMEQRRRLLQFFRQMVPRGETVTVFPEFAGCGIVDNSFGDVRIGSTWLYEVKAGDRSFRSGDLRQLLVYAALNQRSNNPPITDIGLVNPRTGLAFTETLESVSFEASGLSSFDLLFEITQTVSSGEHSA